MPSKTGNGGIDLSAADLKDIDVSTQDFQRHWDFSFIDDSEEYFGVVSGIEPGDVWYINFQVGYSSDVFQLWAMSIQDDGDNNTIYEGVYDEEGLNTTVVFTGDDVVGASGSSSGNIDMVLNQADGTNSGVNMQVYVSAIRLTESESATRTLSPNSNEGFDA